MELLIDLDSTDAPGARSGVLGEDPTQEPPQHARLDTNKTLALIRYVIRLQNCGTYDHMKLARQMTELYLPETAISLAARCKTANARIPKISNLLTEMAKEHGDATHDLTLPPPYDMMYPHHIHVDLDLQKQQPDLIQRRIDAAAAIECSTKSRYDTGSAAINSYNKLSNEARMAARVTRPRFCASMLLHYAAKAIKQYHIIIKELASDPCRREDDYTVPARIDAAANDAIRCTSAALAFYYYDLAWTEPRDEAVKTIENGVEAITLLHLANLFWEAADAKIRPEPECTIM